MLCFWFIWNVIFDISCDCVLVVFLEEQSKQNEGDEKTCFMNLLGKFSEWGCDCIYSIFMTGESNSWDVSALGAVQYVTHSFTVL